MSFYELQSFSVTDVSHVRTAFLFLTTYPACSRWVSDSHMLVFAGSHDASCIMGVFACVRVCVCVTRGVFMFLFIVSLFKK